MSNTLPNTNQQLTPANPPVNPKKLIMDSRKPEVMMLTGNNVKECNRFIKNIRLISRIPALAKCDFNSIINAGLQALALNLELDKDFGYAWVVPYKGSAQFQIGWKGMVQLAIRSGQYETLEVSDVREGELVDYDRLSGAAFKWKDESARQDLKIIGYAARFKLLNGFTKTLYITKEGMELHFQKYSASYRTTGRFAVASFDEMANKTVVKLLLSRWGLLSIEMQQAIKVDQAAINNDGSVVYVDNMKDAPATSPVKSIASVPAPERDWKTQHPVTPPTGVIVEDDISGEGELDNVTF